MRKALYLMLIAVILITIAMAGIKKGNIQEDQTFTQTVQKDIVLQQKYISYYYGHFDGTNTWSEEFKQGMKNTALDIANNTYYSNAEILAAIGYADANFFLTYSQPSIDNFYFPGRESVGYVNASKDAFGSYSATAADEGDVQINIQGNITGEIKVHVWATHNISPLVLDMDGNRKIDTFTGKHINYPITTKEEIQKRTWQVMDIDGDGVLDLVEKLGPNDGLLLVTDNPDKIVQRGFLNGQELFGQSNGYVNGFEKLKEMDLNGDKFISGNELDNLYVYQDINNDGKIQRNEIRNIKELGITKIYTSYTPNMIGSFERNGKIYLMWDWYPNALSVKFNNIK